MRTFLIASFLTLIVIASGAAQDLRGPQAMYVGPDPDFRVSVGIAQGEDERVIIRARQELGSDCTWTSVPDITVPMDDIVTLRDPAAIGGPERYGVLYATTYSALVAYQGGSPNPDYHGCVRQQMTQRARGQEARP